ncbi:MAG TPA: bifunctional protein-serine/threonine kinase/phosphatase [Burkholderiales bacterium]|nr:bifunctional protein-serine/threonine kinase/phosphatase [Burkholderiales bacterium]
MPLEISVGSATATGKRERNEDYWGVVTPEGAELASRGAVLAVADGVSGSDGGREAAEYCVRGLLADYYATPETWEISLAIDRVLTAINRWLVSQGTAHEPHTTQATTLSVLVLRGSRYYSGHVGDSRIYRMRDDSLTRHTEDHVWDMAERSHVLRRAVGLDTHLAMDHGDGELKAGDRFLICSDGVWEPLGDTRIKALLVSHGDSQAAAEALVATALESGGQDNATAVVARIDAVATESWREMIVADRHLPVPTKLKPGNRIDDFEVVRLIHESRATLLYQVRSAASGRTLALKTLQPILSADRESREGLLNEEWLAKRLVSSHFPQVIPIAADARQYLYYVMTYHAGQTLQDKLDSGRHFSTAETVRIGMQVAKGLGALHRLAILHRDIKPANLLQDEDGELRILDLGVALAAGVPYEELQGSPGTPSFMAPELIAGEPASVQSDLYAAGVTLYHLLTRKYPYGELEPFQRPQFGDPTLPTRYRPDIPRWFENFLLRAVARNKGERFETAEEMLYALELGEARPVSAPLPTPLLQRHPAARWQAVAVVSIIVNLLLIYLLFVR